MTTKRKPSKGLSIDDLKSPEGLWIQFYSVNTPEAYVQYATKSYANWLNINKRCRSSDPSNRRNFCYKNTKNLFNNYQEFAEWCNLEFGYSFRDASGKSWEIDKDILGGINADYSSQNCLFIPQSINKLLTQRSSHRGNYPLGVSFRARFNKFCSQCSVDSKQLHLGYYQDPMDAHKAWQIKKAEVIESKIFEYKYHEKLNKGLAVILGKLKLEIENNIETVNLLIGESDQ